MQQNQQLILLKFRLLFIASLCICWGNVSKTTHANFCAQTDRQDHDRNQGSIRGKAGPAETAQSLGKGKCRQHQFLDLLLSVVHWAS